MPKTVLNLIEINLLLNSEEPKNTELYGNLYFVLSGLNKLKAISLDDMPTLDTKARNALSYNKKDLIDTTAREWRATTTILERPRRDEVCELCNTPIKYLCYIFNFKNNTELRVGSECIKKFPNMEGYVEHSKQLKSIHKNQKVITRRNEFYNRFPNCEALISDAENYFLTLPILLPYDLYTKLEDVVKRLRLTYTNYVNEGKKPFKSELTSFELFDLAINQFEKNKNKADEIVNDNINKPLICKRREIDWLLSQNKRAIISKIAKNNGFYNLSTICSITSIEFISGYIENIFNRNQSQLYRFKSLNNGTLQIVFNKHGYFPQITFNMSINDFMHNIGSHCIYDSKFIYSLGDFAQYMKISNTLQNLESVMNYIANLFYEFNCFLLFNEKNNNLWLCRRGDKSIRVFKPYDFLVSYSKHINDSDELLKNFIFSIVRGGSNPKWIVPELQDKYDIKDTVNELYKEQYLDVREQFLRDNKNKYIEIATYNLIRDKHGHIIIDFDHIEYIKFTRSQIHISDSAIKYIEYALYINENNLFTNYKKGTILFVQSTQSIKNNNIIFYTTKHDGLVIKQCVTENNHESIFLYTDAPKKDIVSYGRVIYSFIANLKK